MTQKVFVTQTVNAKRVSAPVGGAVVLKLDTSFTSLVDTVVNFLHCGVKDVFLFSDAIKIDLKDWRFDEFEKDLNLLRINNETYVVTGNFPVWKITKN